MSTLYMLSLGCPKNLVDAELMLAVLTKAGYVVVEEPEAASLLLVNTCGFIRPAAEEAIEEILELAAYKEQDPAKRLVVTGCLVQRYGEDLRDSLPEVDLFVGLDDFAQIDQHIQGLLQRNTGGTSGMVEPAEAGLIYSPGPARYLMDNLVPRQVSTPFFRSYLKITEGCDNCCSYCLIPSIRGRLRSRSAEDLLAEAQRLQAGGVQELALIAQDLSAYGNDRTARSGDRQLGRDNLLVLLRTLLAGTDIPWLRLLYLYPTGVSDELLELMAAEPRLLPYLDIPFQHVSDRVLRAMNRPYTEVDLDELIGRIRSFLPDCAVRTTMMVGFPGETAEDLERLSAALIRWQLDHVGVFTYQDEEGCAAALLPDKVAEEEKERRSSQIMELQAAISAARQQRFVGRIEPVLVEGLSRESDLLIEGRSRYQAAEIDGCVYITSGQVTPGEVVRVHITEAHIYDLVGEIVDDAPSRVTGYTPKNSSSSDA